MKTEDVKTDMSLVLVRLTWSSCQKCKTGGFASRNLSPVGLQ